MKIIFEFVLKINLAEVLLARIKFSRVFFFFNIKVCLQVSVRTTEYVEIV